MSLDPNSPPPFVLPPSDQAHDIYSLSNQLEGFDHDLYQDIQSDQRVFDSLQRWPYLFGLVTATEDE